MVEPAAASRAAARCYGLLQLPREQAFGSKSARYSKACLILQLVSVIQVLRKVGAARRVHVRSRRPRTSRQHGCLGLVATHSS